MLFYKTVMSPPVFHTICAYFFRLLGICHFRIYGIHERFLVSLGTKQLSRYDLLRTMSLLHCYNRAPLQKFTVQSLIAENLVIDKSNQTAIWHVERSKKAHTSAFIHFLQKCSIVKLEETMLRFSTFFRLPSKTNAILMLLLTSFVVILP